MKNNFPSMTYIICISLFLVYIFNYFFLHILVICRAVHLVTIKNYYNITNNSSAPISYFLFQILKSTKCSWFFPRHRVCHYKHARTSPTTVPKRVPPTAGSTFAVLSLLRRGRTILVTRLHTFAYDAHTHDTS